MKKINKTTESVDTIFKEVFDALPDGIIILDKAFNIINMNDAAEAIFTLSRKSVFNKPSRLYLPEEIENTAQRALQEERTIIGEEINPVLRGGETISIQATASPLFSGNGNLTGVLLQTRDLSGSKFISKKILQQLSSVNFEGFIFGLAHELKNPLSGIRGASQLLLNETKNPGVLKCAEIIIKEADRLRNLIDKFERLEPLSKDVFELVDIHEILSEIIFLESRSNRAKEIKFIHNFDITMPPILGDANALKQVFLNIIKNAKEADQSKSAIDITTRWITDYKIKNENAISVVIRDYGKGISKEDLEKIFTPFYTTKKNGSGLGLFIAYQIIAKHGGAIFVESELGKGTAFNVYLPLYK